MAAIKTVAVVGAGAMGAQIAMLGALAGYETYLTDVSEVQMAKALEQLRARLNGWAAKGKLPADHVVAGFARLHTTTELAQAVAGADFVIEAVVEDLEVKRQLFTQLDRLAPPHAILATNSSTLVSSKLADTTQRPAQVCNVHFFNPPLVMAMVEVVQGPHTSPETAEAAMELCRRLGKEPILLHKEIFGFVVNRILGALMNEALYLYEEGVASVEDIDKAVMKALGHPMGPFRLMDFTGIDVNYKVGLEKFRETGDPADQPKQTLRDLYEAGRLGMKSGRGFYEWPQG